MSERNGNLIGLGKQVVSTLPPAFVLLLLLNTIFLGAVFWFINSRAVMFERSMAPILASCMNKIPLELLPHLKTGG